MKRAGLPPLVKGSLRGNLREASGILGKSLFLGPPHMGRRLAFPKQEAATAIQKNPIQENLQEIVLNPKVKLYCSFQRVSSIS